MRNSSINVIWYFLWSLVNVTHRIWTFVLAGLLCVSFNSFPSDIDECSRGQHNCDAPERGICNNTHGSFLCQCRHGYCGEDGRNCKGLWFKLQFCNLTLFQLVHLVYVAILHISMKKRSQPSLSVNCVFLHQEIGIVGKHFTCQVNKCFLKAGVSR